VAVPGSYQVKLTVGGKALSAPLEIKLDPRLSTSPADLEKQFKLLLQIRDRVTQAHDTVNAMRDIRTQLTELQKRVGKESQAEAIVAAAKELDKKMSAVEEEIIQVKARALQDTLNYPIKLYNKVTALTRVVSSADTAPTQQSYEMFEELSQQLEKQLARWKEIVEKDLAGFNRLVRSEDIPPVILPAATPPR
jgi:hypothetical protein